MDDSDTLSDVDMVEVEEELEDTSCEVMCNLLHESRNLAPYARFKQPWKKFER